MPTTNAKKAGPVFTLLHDARPVLLNLDEPGGFDITPWVDRVQLVATPSPLVRGSFRHSGQSLLPPPCCVSGDGASWEVPVIKDSDRTTVNDSTAIIEYLQNKYPSALDEGVSAAERAQMFAFNRMIDEHTCRVAVLQPRWRETCRGAPPSARRGRRDHRVNYPLLLAMFKLTPALLVGNTIVLKPSPNTPVVTSRLGELAQEFFPPGVSGITRTRAGDRISEAFGVFSK